MTNPSSVEKEKRASSSSIQSSPRTDSTEAPRDPLTQIERRRVQNLLLDEKNLLANRID